MPDLTALLRLLRDESFDLIIVPLQDMGAVELATLEREVVRNAASMVIGTAPQADPGLIVQAMRAGVQEFLVFPPNAQEFSAAVDRLMRRGRPEAEQGTTIAVYSARRSPRPPWRSAPSWPVVSSGCPVTSPPRGARG